MEKRVRVRYAPSPTGHLHIGNARTALYVYLFARHYNGDMVLRIEDTDLERNVEGGEESQARFLHWLGIDWNEGPEKGGEYGPYRQLERLDTYKKYADELMEKGFAYKCFCTEEELTAEREAQMAAGMPTTRYSGKCRHLSAEERQALEAEGKEYTIRFAVPTDETYEWEDIVRDNIKFESKDVGDWVIVKKNGIPTYNYACVIDDYLMEISHVLRGEEHISNTPKQLMVYRALGWEAPGFGHMAVIVNENRKKLSKRDEAVIQFIEQYHDLGYLPEALFNFIALLGWSPVGEEEIFSKDEFISIFDPKRLSAAPAMFDRDKLAWINNRYVKAATLEEVVALAKPHLAKAYDLSDKSEEWVTNLIALYKDQMSYGAEIVELVDLFFKDALTLNEEAQAVIDGEQVKEVLTALVQELQALDTLAPDTVKASVKAVQKATGQKGKALFMPIRVATTGQTHGPELPNAIVLLGKEKVIARLQSFIG
ncbi:glutamate--tRNA ligase [Priestia taiwanensis]|uniref:Glutamate--tRNA ligase n=1 Tax=Priestia taiwanensis TaxID=1347902 RepID=A0A917AWW1_9BACI|nr:glutamate--tRNA ligase [Priestia taiwanensis]MBM7365140.1 nondiscriminating glutamyl-tRNA synthetase [Priestia taiwanensis]GGE83973.1 glutamate--tRNA ligase [Priestia taiwanensis]